MEPEGSLPCSQEPAIESHPEPDASSPHLPTKFPKIHSKILSSMPRFSMWPFPFRFSDKKFVCISHLFPCVVHAPAISVMKLFIMQFYPASCFCPPFTSKRYFSTAPSVPPCLCVNFCRFLTPPFDHPSPRLGNVVSCSLPFSLYVGVRWWRRLMTAALVCRIASHDRCSCSKQQCGVQLRAVSASIHQVRTLVCCLIYVYCRK
jgi:hypothetical protein